MKTIQLFILSMFCAGCVCAAPPPLRYNWFTTNTSTEPIGWTNTSADGIRSQRITTSNFVVSAYGTNYANQISPASGTKLIIGSGINHGLSNNVLSSRSAAIGGTFNFAAGVVISGIENTNNNINDSVIVGGNLNLIDSASDNYGAIIGGTYNVMNSGADNSVIVGGIANSNYSADQSVIIGGASNNIAGINSAIVGGVFNTVVGAGAVLIGYGQTNTANNQVCVGYGANNIAFSTSGVKVSGLNAISFIQTNGITGIQTNYTYFTNGLAFTNIAYPGWVAWP